MKMRNKIGAALLSATLFTGIGVTSAQAAAPEPARVGITAPSWYSSPSGNCPSHLRKVWQVDILNPFNWRVVCAKKGEHVPSFFFW